MLSLQTKPRILFVDDEASVLDAYRRMLHPFASNWSMLFQTDSRAVLEFVQCHSVDVVVTDVSMPFLSGIELLEKLQRTATTQHIPVIVITGQHDRDLKRRALDAGATDLMNKPVEQEELLARLRSSLRLKAYSDELNLRNAELEQRVSARTRDLQQSRLEIIMRLAMAAEFRDTDTGRHVVRVAQFSRLIAQQLGLRAEEVDAIFVAAPLHDVGKIAIPDSILLKSGKLTEEERIIMQTHCGIGGRILGRELSYFFDVRPIGSVNETEPFLALSDPVLETARQIATTHHEHWDGGGYPLGLSGEWIPISGRIVAIADVYDALTTKRSYKPALPMEQALELISVGVGRQFDPRVHAAFLQVLPEIEKLRRQFSDLDSTESESKIPTEAILQANSCTS